MRWLVLVLALLFPLGLIAQTTDEERDRSFLSDTIEGLISTEGQTVRIDGFRGALSSQATVARLSIADAQGEWLIARDLELDWSRAALFSRRLEIERLAAGSIEILRAPAGDSPPPRPEAVPFALPELPVAVHIGAIAADSITLGAALLGQELELRLDGSADLAGGAGEAAFTATRIDGIEGEVTLSGGFSNETRVLALDLGVTEEPGGIVATLLGIPGAPAIDLAVTGTAPLDDYEAELRLASAGVERVQGRFGLRAAGDGGQVWTLDMQGDVTPLLAPDYRAFFGQDVALHVTALQGADGSVDLSDLSVSASAVRIEGNARIGRGGWPEAFALSADIGLGGDAPVRLPAGGAPLFVQAATLSLDFDEARSDDWTGQLSVDGLVGEGFLLDRLWLDGGGRIVTPERDSPGGDRRGFTLDMVYRADGLMLEDPGLAQAVGNAATGRIAMVRDGDSPVTLQALSISGPGVEATLSGTLGGERLAYDLRLALQAGDLARFAQLVGLDLGGAADLDITLQGRLLDRSLSLTATGGTRDLALGIGMVDPLLAGEGVLSLAASRDAEGLRVERLIARTAALSATGIADLTSAATTGHFALTLLDAGRLVSGLEGQALVALDLRDDEEGLTVFADAGLIGVNVRARATRAPEDEDFALSLTGTIPDLSVFAGAVGIDLQGRADLAARGSAGADGADMALALRAGDLSTGIGALDPLLGGEAVLGARIAQDADGVLRLDRLTVSAEQLRAAGTVERSPDGVISLDLAASIPGAEAHVGGALVDGSFAGAVDLDSRDLGTLTGGAVAGAANVTASGKVALDLASVDIALSGVTRDLDAGIAALVPLTAGPGTIEAQLHRVVDGPWRIVAARLATSGATLAGEGESDGVAASGTVTLELPDMRLVLPALGGRGQVRADMSRDADGILALDAQAEGAGAQATLSARADGVDPMQGISGQLHLEAADLRPLGRMAGITLGGGARADLSGHVVPTDLSGDISLAASLRNLDPGNADLARVLAGEGRVAVRVMRGADGEIALQDARIDFPNFSASGSAGGTVDDLTATWSARLANVGLLAPDFSGPATAEGHAGLRGGDWTVDAALAGPGGMSGQLSGGIGAGGRPDLQATGRLPLGLLNGFIEPRRLRGEAAFDLRLVGRMALDALSGSLRVSGAEAADPELGLRVADIGGGVTLAGGRATLDLRSSVNNSGTLAVTGGIGLDGALPADLRLVARGVSLRDPELYETTASGDITITGPLDGVARVAGSIDLGVTELQIPSSDIGAFGDLPDVTHVGAPADVALTLARAGVNGNGASEAGSGGPGYALDVLLSAPSRIFIRGRGLDAELGGSLRLGGTTANIVPSGAFTLIRGRLDILQQRFVLNEGSAVLQGSFIPWLHLVARTRARSGTDIAIILEGPADAPVVTFSSQPELPQDEVLAQLLFGRDIASITPLQAVQLAAAVATLAGRGGGGIVDGLRTGLGVDDLDIVTDESGGAGLRLGRYLSDNIYTDVTLGAETEVNINLDLTRDLTVTGSVDTDGETRLGIHYEHDY